MEGTGPNGANGNGAPSPNHAPNGKFAPGNKAAVGRTAKVDWRQALRRVVSTDELEQVWLAVLTEAKGGDMRAASLLLSYVVGRPKEVDPEPLEEEVDATPRWEFC